MPAEEASFLSRWSRRKQAAREAAPVPAPELLPVAAEAPAALPVEASPAPPTLGDTAAPPALTLEDVAQLTPSSDFTGFVARGVSPEVKNAALKKLFTDPHFNVMDGLDTYIDDYGKPDPLPAGMLRQMVQSQVLGLFSDDPDPAKANSTPTPPLPAPAAPMLPPAERLADPNLSPAPHEDADLQLQPDDAAGRPGPAASPGQNAGREH